jgi:RND superfamily putative drug exporter
MRRQVGDYDKRSIAWGMEHSGPVITAAGLIMIGVFGSFILNGDPTVKQFGVGLSVGVGLAAMTVLLLAPALLVLAGQGSWWMPRWAERALPRVDIEGAHVAAQEAGERGA